MQTVTKYRLLKSRAVRVGSVVGLATAGNGVLADTVARVPTVCLQTCFIFFDV